MNYPEDLSALVVSALTGAFLLLSFSFFILIVFRKLKQLNEDLVRNKIWVKIQNHLAQMLIQSAYGEGDWDYSSSVQSLKDSIKRSKLIKQWLLDEMIKQRANLSGEAHTTLMKIYSELDFKAFSLKKLNSRSWFKAAQGIKELEQMKQHDCFTHFYKFVNHRNKELRKVSRMGLTALAPNPLSFLDYLKEEITEWEQMNIASRLKEKGKDQLPKFYQYYRHSQPSVAIFCLRMSVEFGCYDHIPLMINLLEDSNEDLQIAIINGLTELGAFHAHDVINEIAFTRDDVSAKVLIAALRFLGELGSEDDKNEITNMINHDEIDVRMQAVRSAVKLGLNLEDTSEEIARMTLHHQHKLIA